jgi:hypothetical protein
MNVMPRFCYYTVILALLATPLALVARGIACNPSQCDCMAMCARQAAAQSMRLCGASRHAAPMCGTHRGNHALDYGFIAPMAPTAPVAPARLAQPDRANEFVASYSQSPVIGFSSTLFQPPRA